MMNAPEVLTLEKQIIVPFDNTRDDDDSVGSVATFFTVTPTTNNDNWLTKIVNTSTDIATISPELVFCFESPVSTSKIQRELEQYQKVVLISDLEQTETELWQFYGDGAVFINKPSTAKLRVQSEIKNQGKRLVITIDNVANNLVDDLKDVDLEFRYIASCINSLQGAGELKVYYSQDPKIRVRRRQEN